MKIFEKPGYENSLAFLNEKQPQIVVGINIAYLNLIRKQAVESARYELNMSQKYKLFCCMKLYKTRNKKSL